MLSSPDRPRNDRRLLAAALALSILIHLAGGGLWGYLGHRLAALARLVPIARPTPEVVALSDAIRIEKRSVPPAVRRNRATKPQQRRLAPRAVPRVAVAEPVPTAAPTVVPSAAPTAPPTVRPQRGTIHVPARAAASASRAALSAQQLAALDAQFSKTIAQSHRALADIPKPTAPPAAMKRYDVLMSGKPQDVLNAEGECTEVRHDTSRSTEYVWYRCSIVYSDNFRETVTFPWPFRYPRGRAPLPGQVFDKQAPPSDFDLPKPFAPSRAVCSFYKPQCDALLARERAEGAPEYWTPRGESP